MGQTILTLKGDKRDVGFICRLLGWKNIPAITKDNGGGDVGVMIFENGERDDCLLSVDARKAGGEYEKMYA